ARLIQKARSLSCCPCSKQHRSWIDLTVCEQFDYRIRQQKSTRLCDVFVRIGTLYRSRYRPADFRSFDGLVEKRHVFIHCSANFCHCFARFIFHSYKGKKTATLTKIPPSGTIIFNSPNMNPDKETRFEWWRTNKSIGLFLNEARNLNA